MRLATYNIEWFNSLFDDAGALLNDTAWSARYKVTRARQTEAIAMVMTALDADGVMIIEAPDQNGRRDTVRALETFARSFKLRTRKAILGFHTDTQQEIAFLYDPDALTPRHDPQGEMTGKKGAQGAPRFDAVFRWDLDVDASSDLVRFSKPPLELAVQTASGQALRLIGVHVKSKAPHGATSKAEVMRISIENRRKQLAQCIWLRNRVDTHLAAGDPLIVMGDFNDGPGLDEYEKLFGRSGVEIVLGHGQDEPLQLFDPHAKAALTQRLGPQVATARFYHSERKQFFSALLDYIMLSPGLMAKRPAWHIWHPFDDPACYKLPDLREALLDASDHFPVTVDLDL